ncbi:MAG: hypothetical protein JWR24_2123 [Actinoallomurus sp.]|nr:hypothetical protein [Actinoallomurus sp.]
MTQLTLSWRQRMRPVQQHLCQLFEPLGGLWPEHQETGNARVCLFVHTGLPPGGVDTRFHAASAVTVAG